MAENDSVAAESPAPAPTKRFTRKELEARNHKDDAVFVIDNVVYDVTKFLDEHPGGHEVLLDRAGKDASENFDDVGHSWEAKELMLKYRVGEVADADRVPVTKRAAAFEEPRDDGSASAWHTWLVPVVLGVLATTLYGYLFG